MPKKDVYEKLVMNIKEGLQEGEVNGQSFQELIDKGHTLEMVLNDYVICGGSKGNMLNMLDENFETEDYYHTHLDHYETCICGKQDLQENVHITLFIPGASKGVSKHNPTLAIGNHCQRYFQTIEQKRTEYINQQNKRANEEEEDADATMGSTNQREELLSDSDDEDAEENETDSSYREESDEEEEEDAEEYDTEDDGDGCVAEQEQEQNDLPTNRVTDPPISANISYTIICPSSSPPPFDNEPEVLQDLLPVSRQDRGSLLQLKRDLCRSVEKYEYKIAKRRRKIAKINRQLQSLDDSVKNHECL